MRAVRYRPDAGNGGWRAAVTGSALAVLPPEVTPHAVEAVWRGLDGGGIGAVLESLTGAFGTSLTAIPPFALAVAEGDGVRVAVRGPVEFVVETASGVESVSGAGVSTWTERFLSGATRLTIDLDVEGAADLLPIESGVVAVAALVFTPAGEKTPSGAMPMVAAAEAPAPAADPANVVPDAPEPAAEADRPPAGPAAEEAPADEAAADEAAADGGKDDATEAVAEPPADEAVIEPPAEETEVAPADEESPSDAGSLVTGVPGATIIPGPRDAVGDTVAAPSDDPVLGETIVSPRKPSAPVSPPPVPSLPPFVPPAPPIPPQLGDHDGATVSVAQARAMRAAAAGGGQPAAAEPAVPAYDSTENVPERSPSQGRIVVSDGRRIELERTVIVGRRPRSTRPAESELPTLIAVDGPQHDISRNHVEIRAEGEHVLAIDLASTNGTVLLRGGHDPVRLHPNEPTMVIDADVLDLGDGVTLTFEDLP
ncbi:FHA domain-containing protein [Microbacterium sp.]|uniref:FHA domain-containing protein n=1 Tax=Microbacterium sp. TaxID=51671 RepID=UPI003734DC30